MSRAFEYDSYRELLREALHQGKRVVAFRDMPDSDPFLLLRHDIDFSIERALVMARIEEALGVTATYFVLLSAPYYNALEARSLRMLREIVSAGHELGLHYEVVSLEGVARDRWQGVVEAQCGALSAVLEVEIGTVAQHKPTRAGVLWAPRGFQDAYADEFVGRIPYLSDSRMVFDLEQARRVMSSNARVQLLIHPIWWSERPRNRGEVFGQLSDEVTVRLDRQLTGEHEAIEARLDEAIGSGPPRGRPPVPYREAAVGTCRSGSDKARTPWT